MPLPISINAALAPITDKREQQAIAAAFATLDRTEITVATRQLLREENGLTLFLDAATEFVTTLPPPFQGARYTIIVSGAPVGANYTVVTSGSANIIKGQAYVCADAAGDAGTADDTITFVASQAVAGDMVMLFSDGTSWFAKAFCAVAAGVTFTQAS